MPPASERRSALWFVAGQFGLLALLIVTPVARSWPRPGWLVAGSYSVAAVGLAFAGLAALWLGRGLTALPLPNGRTVLRTSGPYRFVRHPIYSGLLLFAITWSIGGASARRAGLAVAFAVLLDRKAAWEEHRLAARFPDYQQYVSATGRFVPRLGART